MADDPRAPGDPAKRYVYPTRADQLRAARAELEVACARFRVEDRRLDASNRRGRTTNAWAQAALRRDDALRRLAALDPEDARLLAERRDDLRVRNGLRVKVGRRRIASLAGRLFGTDLPAGQVLSLCLDHNVAQGFWLSQDEVERVVRWVAGREADRLAGRA